MMKIITLKALLKEKTLFKSCRGGGGKEGRKKGREGGRKEGRKEGKKRKKLMAISKAT